MSLENLVKALRGALVRPSTTASFGQQKPNYNGRGPVRVRRRRNRPVVAVTGRRRTGRPVHVVEWERRERLSLVRRCVEAQVPVDETWLDESRYRRHVYAALVRAEALQT